MKLMQQHTDDLDSQLQSDHQYIADMVDCMKAISASLTGLQKMGDSALHVVLENLLKPATPNPKTPDADDLLPPVTSATQGAS